MECALLPIPNALIISVAHPPPQLPHAHKAQPLLVLALELVKALVLFKTLLALTEIVVQFAQLVKPPRDFALHKTHVLQLELHALMEFVVVEPRPQHVQTMSPPWEHALHRTLALKPMPYARMVNVVHQQLPLALVTLHRF
jgi:hypothetical protein